MIEVNASNTCKNNFWSKYNILNANENQTKLSLVFVTAKNSVTFSILV